MVTGHLISLIVIDCHIFAGIWCRREQSYWESVIPHMRRENKVFYSFFVLNICHSTGLIRFFLHIFYCHVETRYNKRSYLDNNLNEKRKKFYNIYIYSVYVPFPSYVYTAG